MKKLRRIYLILIVTVSALVIATCGALTFAWFSPYGRVVTEDGGSEYARLGMKLDLLFDMINSDTQLTSVAEGANLGIVSTTYSLTDYSSETADDLTKYYKLENGQKRYAYGVDDNNVCYYLYDSNASWGSANNPYVISQVRHIQNLSILQEIGYFYDLYVKDFVDSDGAFTYTGEKYMPYFLVCEPDGTPVTIEGGNIEFSPIGTDTYPFIGYVGGAFNSGTTTVGEMTSDQSVIKDINISTTEDLVDVGFFGCIGYLKTVSSEATGDTEFHGFVSTIEDLLLYDVTITVNQTTIADIVGEFGSHLFSFLSSGDTVTADNSQYTVPHENHHFGILAGHVEYSTVRYISVYYSDNSTPAIDVSHIVSSSSSMPANYYSVCGIIGYIDHMNASAGNGLIDGTTGMGNDDVAVTTGGIGTGGGELSGTGRGYVTAASLSSNYYVPYSSSAHTGTRANASVPNNAGQEVWEYYVKDNAAVQYGIMLDCENGIYTLHEDSGISASVSGGTATVDGSTWTNYIVRTVGTPDTYEDQSGTEVTSFHRMNLTILNGISLEDGKNLCTEYIRNRILWGTENTGMYYFYDGVFTFALSDSTDVIEDTWKNNEPDTITLGEDDSDKWTSAENGEANAIVAFAKPVTSQNDMSSGRKLFITYKDDSDNYHLVTLAGNSTYTQGNMNDAVTTQSTTLGLVSDEKKAQLKTALDSGGLTLDSADEESGDLITQEELQEQWNSIAVFDVGTATAAGGIGLSELRQKYQVSYRWDDSEADNKIYEDDGVTEATDTLKNNSKTVQDTYYQINATVDTDVTVTETGSGKTFTYFDVTGASTVNVSNLSSAITTQNGITYEDDWTTDITNAASPLSQMTLGNPITQTEAVQYTSGYFYFKTDRQWKYYHYLYYLLYYYMDGSGNSHYLGESAREDDGDFEYNWQTYLNNAFTKGNTDVSGTYLYTSNVGGSTANLPLLYLKNSTYYQSWSRNWLDTAFLSGSNEADFNGNIYYNTFTNSYNYIIATLTGSGVVYTWMNTTEVVSNVVNTGTTVASSTNQGLGIYYADSGGNVISKNYTYYTCSGNRKGILLTRYDLDGYSLKSLKGDGIKYYLNGEKTSVLSGRGDKTSTKSSTLNLVSGMNAPRYTLSLNGSNYDLYTVDGNLVVRVANYGVDGYILATVLNTETNYVLYPKTGSNVTQTNVERSFKDSDGNPLTVSISNGSATKNYALYTTAQGSLAILLITNGQSGGTYEFSHSNKDDNNGDYKLRLLMRRYIASYYSVMVGTDTYATTASNFRGNTTPTVSNTTEAKLSFNTDGSCYISYTINGQTRYLHYDTANDHFDTSSSKTETGTKLYLFTVEGTHNTSPSNLIVPVGNTSKGTFSADQYVLYPETTLTGDDTDAETSEDPVYDLVSLTELYSSDNGWKNSQGTAITNEDLYKRFSLTYEISWGMTLNVFNGSWNFGSGGINNATTIVAPIGSNGEEANIPRGCIAFKINDSSQPSYGIRVIVSIPTSAYVPGEDGYSLDTDEDYYFGIWQTESAGESTIQSFEKDNSLEKFELPRSHPYANGADPATSDYITVSYGDETCRAYLHGDQILVAYKFEVTEPGVYVIGATNGPMQIVYFSADSTASSGRDGTSSYKLGTIDFVYDYGGKIVTVKDGKPSSTTNSTEDEDYNYYYPTLCIVNTNNGMTPVTGDTDISYYTVKNTTTPVPYPNINDFQIYVNREIETENSESHSELQYRITSTQNYDKNYIPFTRYAVNSDVLVATDVN